MHLIGSVVKVRRKDKMYQFGPHEAMHAQEGPFGDPSQAATMNYSDMGHFRGGGRSSSSNNSSNLEEKLRVLGFSHGVHDPCMGVKDELNCQLELKHMSLMHAGAGGGYAPTALSGAPFGMLNQDPINPASAPVEMAFQDLPPEVAAVAAAVYYDPTVQFDLSGQPPMVREMLSSMQHGGADQFITGFISGGSYFELDRGDGYADEGKQNSGKRKKGGPAREEKEDGEGLKNEKERRERFGKKFIDLRSLIPNATKNDRASILADTIDYINELLRTVKELNILVEKKRLRRLRTDKRPAAAAAPAGGELAADMEDSSLVPFAEDSVHRPLKDMLRSSWLQRKSKDTSIDVRIVEDEVYIKLTQRRRPNCLLVLSGVLEELHLELLHLSGGNIGDSHIFMFNTKIHERHPVYASAVAEKLIEVMGSSADAPMCA